MLIMFFQRSRSILYAIQFYRRCRYNRKRKYPWWVYRRDRLPIVPGYLCGSVTGSTGASNALGVLTEPGQQNKYTLELWARLKISAFSGTYSTAYDIVSTASGNSKIYIENSLVTFMLTDDSDNVYRATARHTDFDESMHIAAVYSPDGFL